MSANILSKRARTRLCTESSPRDCVCVNRYTEIQMNEWDISKSADTCRWDHKVQDYRQREAEGQRGGRSERWKVKE